MGLAQHILLMLFQQRPFSAFRLAAETDECLVPVPPPTLTATAGASSGDSWSKVFGPRTAAGPVASRRKLLRPYLSTL